MYCKFPGRMIDPLPRLSRCSSAPFQHIGNNLHVAVAMCGKPIARRHPILVHHPQRTKAHSGRIVIIGERKGVMRIEPTMIGMAPVVGFEELNHVSSQCSSRCRESWIEQIIQGRATSPGMAIPGLRARACEGVVVAGWLAE